MKHLSDMRYIIATHKFQAYSNKWIIRHENERGYPTDYDHRKFETKEEAQISSEHFARLLLCYSEIIKTERIYCGALKFIYKNKPID